MLSTQKIKKNNKMRYIVIIIMILLSGCYTTYNDISSFLPKKQRYIHHHKTVNSVLKYYFTDSAYKSIKNIPMVDGISNAPYVVGVNGWSIFISIFIGNGYGRKVVINPCSLKSWGIKGIIHEYIHHLDDMDRDGIKEFIDHNEFIEAYKRLSMDTKYAGIVHYVEKKANYWFTNWFGVGEYSEYIAYTGGFIFKNDAPDYLKHVYRKILRFR